MLWIRSQDKSNLKKVNNIYVEEITKDYDRWIGNIYSQPYVLTSDEGNLGFYATKERALEVLDEIQILLQPIIKYEPIVQEEYNPAYEYTHFVKVGDNMEIKESSTFVYEMPDK